MNKHVFPCIWFEGQSSSGFDLKNWKLETDNDIGLGDSVYLAPPFKTYISVLGGEVDQNLPSFAWWGGVLAMKPVLSGMGSIG